MTRYLLPLITLVLLAAACGDEEIQVTEWRLIEDPTGPTLKLSVAVGGSCDSFARVDVDETTTSVSIDAYIRHSNPGAGRGCDAYLSFEDVTVELQGSLGNRALVGCDPLPNAYYFDNVNDCTEPIH